MKLTLVQSPPNRIPSPPSCLSISFQYHLKEGMSIRIVWIGTFVGRRVRRGEGAFQDIEVYCFVFREGGRGCEAKVDKNLDFFEVRVCMMES